MESPTEEVSFSCDETVFNPFDSLSLIYDTTEHHLEPPFAVASTSHNSGEDQVRIPTESTTRHNSSEDLSIKCDGLGSPPSDFTHSRDFTIIDSKSTMISGQRVESLATPSPMQQAYCSDDTVQLSDTFNVADCTETLSKNPSQTVEVPPTIEKNAFVRGEENIEHKSFALNAILKHCPDQLKADLLEGKYKHTSNYGIDPGYLLQLVVQEVKPIQNARDLLPIPPPAVKKTNRKKRLRHEVVSSDIYIKEELEHRQFKRKAIELKENNKAQRESKQKLGYEIQLQIADAKHEKEKVSQGLNRLKQLKTSIVKNKDLKSQADLYGYIEEMKKQEILKHEISSKIDRLLIEKRKLVSHRLPKTKVDIEEPKSSQDDDTKILPEVEFN